MRFHLSDVGVQHELDLRPTVEAQQHFTSKREVAEQIPWLYRARKVVEVGERARRGPH